MGTKDYWWLDGKVFEQEAARVLQETGVIGFILVYAARIWLLVKAISLGRTVSDTAVRGDGWCNRGVLCSILVFDCHQ